MTWIVVGLTAGAAEELKTIPVEIAHEKAKFSGQMGISLSGTMDKAKVEWDATIRNLAGKRLFRVTFCVKAFAADDRELKPAGNDCALTLSANNWEYGAPLTLKGKQNIKISDEKAQVQVVRYVIAATEVFDRAPNLRDINVSCALVWPAARRVFAARKFRPTATEKDSFTTTYAYDGVGIDGYRDARQLLKAFTTANTLFTGPAWESFRIDAATLYLREEKPGTCAAEVKMRFAGLGKPFSGWSVVESNFNFEKTLLDRIEAESR